MNIYRYKFIVVFSYPLRSKYDIFKNRQRGKKQFKYTMNNTIYANIILQLLYIYCCVPEWKTWNMCYGLKKNKFVLYTYYLGRFVHCTNGIGFVYIWNNIVKSYHFMSCHVQMTIVLYNGLQFQTLYVPISQ